ncbi:MAG: MBL fold metallo-hydrolase [Negativicutes bacterium]|nr:MBL fold metallo-hydrolase [Negativicutes bacterium]
MRLTFLGASMMVTGSSYLLEVGNRKILVDCGMFQGSKATEALNRRPFQFDPATIDAVLLTHAHIDHSGLLPRLCKSGYRGKIYTSKATTDLCRIMLADSAHIQEFEAEIGNRKGRRAGKVPVEPLYTVADAEHCLKQFQPVPYNELFDIFPEIRVKLDDAGHILGSSIIEIWLSENDKTVKLVFSGDLGRPDQPIIKDPTYIDEADYIIMETTYGDRRHEHYDQLDALAGIINDTVKRGGNIVIPAFAVGRTQTILYFLHQLLKAGKIPDIPVFIDSPLAISATDIFMHNPQEFDVEAYDMIYKQQDNPLKLPHLNFTRTSDESKAINLLDEPVIIISASGMADAGRILHHLKHNLWRPEASILFVGYQAQGSLGRRLLEGAKRVKIMGEEISVKAKIHNMEGFSAHADQEQLLDWLEHLKTPPANVFLVHGEHEAAEAFAKVLAERLHLPAYIPHYGDSAILDGRNLTVESSSITLLDPKLQQLHEVLDQLDSDYMELKRRLEHLAAEGGQKLPDVLQDVERAARFIRKTAEAVGDGKH